MNGDIIKCLNPYCNMEFKDTTKLKMQDSRKGQFINRCPYCLGVNTINTNESAVKKTKFIYRGISTHGGTKHTKSTKHVKKVDLDTEHIATKILGIRKGCNVKEELNDFPSGRTLPMGEPIKNEGYFQKHGATTVNVAQTKPYTPQELMQQKINNRLEEMKSPPDNYKKYNRWWYRRQKE